MRCRDTRCYFQPIDAVGALSKIGVIFGPNVSVSNRKIPPILMASHFGAVLFPGQCGNFRAGLSLSTYLEPEDPIEADGLA
jgi:hypothetical protein